VGNITCRTGSVSGRGDDSINEDLTNPLFQAESAEEDYNREDSSSSKTVIFHDSVNFKKSQR